MQNPDFKSKIRIPKKHVKIHSTNHFKLFCAKHRSKIHQIIEKWEHFENRPSCKGYSPCKLFTLGQKLKFKKHVKIHSTNHLQLFCENQKTHAKSPKNTKYSRNKTILKIGHHAKAIAHAMPMKNLYFGSKIRIPKNMSKSILQIILSCSVQKTAPKNTKYSRNKTILKIGHHAKAIAHAKSSLWVKN